MEFLLFHAAGISPIPVELKPIVLVPGMAETDRLRAVHTIEKAIQSNAKIIQDHGFAIKTIWDSSLANIPSLILKNAKKANADMIAVTAQAGPAHALFLGSVTRELLRVSPLPVWVAKG